MPSKLVGLDRLLITGGEDFQTPAVGLDDEPHVGWAGVRDLNADEIVRPSAFPAWPVGRGTVPLDGLAGALRESGLLPCQQHTPEHEIREAQPNDADQRDLQLANSDPKHKPSVAHARGETRSTVSVLPHGLGPPRVTATPASLVQSESE